LVLLQCGFIASTLILPDDYSKLKFLSLYSLLAFSLMTVLYRLFDVRWSKVLLLVLVPGVWGGLNGWLISAPGLESEIKLYLLAVVAYILAFSLVDPYLFVVLRKVIKVISYAHIAIFVVALASFGNPYYDRVREVLGFHWQYAGWYVKIFTSQITQVLFLLPAVMGYYYYEKKGWGGLAIGLALMIILSGRLVGIVVLVAIIFYFFKPLKILLSLFFFGVVFVFVGFVFGQGHLAWPNWHLLMGDVYIGDNIRVIQAKELIRLISMHPIFGSGLGFVSDECIRSAEMPWRFEWVYLKVILNVGMFGFLVYLYFYISFLRKIGHVINCESQVYPILLGSIGFVVASSTNPYIMSVTNIWILFIPYIVYVGLISKGRLEKL